MKLRNKKTGEIADVEIQGNCILVTHQDGRIEQYYFDSIKDLLEWEDYEEPEIGFIIDPMEEDYISADDDSGYDESDIEMAKIEAQRTMALASVSPRHNGDAAKTIEEIIQKAGKYVERT